MKSTALDFSAFLSDERLGQMIERLKTGDDLLKIVTLLENQHSDLLSWMFDAREGHGQGDEILRDLLLSAVNALNDDGAHLNKSSRTYKFLAAWSIPRIRATSFSAAFAGREVSLSRSSRPDLLLVDPQNKFVLVIENKAGSKLGKDQLDKYRVATDFLDKHWMLKEYDRAFIALNRELDSIADAKKQPSPYWLTMSYDWLKHAAKRASMHVKRGNQAASLVVSYCQQQTEWKSEEEAAISALASELVICFEPEVRFLASLGSKLVKSWLATPLVAGADAHLWTFTLQNRVVVNTLVEMSGLIPLEVQIRNRLPKAGEADVQRDRKYLSVIPNGVRKFVPDIEDKWPIYLLVHLQRTDAVGANMFSISLRFFPNHLPKNLDIDKVREALSALLPKREAGKATLTQLNSLGKGLTYAQTLDSLVEWERRVTASLPR